MLPSLCLWFASIKRLMLRYRAQMVCNYHGGGAVPFNLRQWKEDTQTCKTIIRGPSVETKEHDD